LPLLDEIVDEDAVLVEVQLGVFVLVVAGDWNVESRSLVKKTFKIDREQPKKQTSNDYSLI